MYCDCTLLFVNIAACVQSVLKSGSNRQELIRGRVNKGGKVQSADVKARLGGTQASALQNSLSPVSWAFYKGISPTLRLDLMISHELHA
jgi:hypothetical protein